MKIITRQIAIENLKKYIGQDLRKLALKHGITTYETGKQNKGWKGLVLERLAGLENNVSKAPNGLTYELKSVSFRNKKEVLVPKETMAITMINPEELKAHSFFESHCWSKLKKLTQVGNNLKILMLNSKPSIIIKSGLSNMQIRKYKTPQNKHYLFF